MISIFLFFCFCFCSNDCATSESSSSSSSSDILIFSSFKPCAERDSNVFIAQLNAVQSWLSIRPPCHVAVFGDERGVEELLNDATAAMTTTTSNKPIHIKKVVRGPGDLPLVNELFQAAEQLADSLAGNVRALVYANGDVLLTDELRHALTFLLDNNADERLSSKNKEFFLVGKRYDSNRFNNKRIDFADNVAWQSAVRAAAHRIAPDFKHNDNRWAIDYFAWSRGFFNRNPLKIIPPFSLGIVAFDNWLLHYANMLAKQLQNDDDDDRPIIVVDASLVIPAVHQFHTPTKNNVDREPLRKRNRELAKHWHFGRVDAAEFQLEFCNDKSHFEYELLPQLCLLKRSP